MNRTPQTKAGFRSKSKSQNVGFNVFFLSGFWRGCKRVSFSKRFGYWLAQKIRFCGHCKPVVSFCGSWCLCSTHTTHPEKPRFCYTKTYVFIRQYTKMYVFIFQILLIILQGLFQVPFQSAFLYLFQVVSILLFFWLLPVVLHSSS
jgi:hypothetical protein